MDWHGEALALYAVRVGACSIQVWDTRTVVRGPCRVGIAGYEWAERGCWCGLGGEVVGRIAVNDVAAFAVGTVVGVDEGAAIHRAAHIPHVEVDTYRYWLE